MNATERQNLKAALKRETIRYAKGPEAAPLQDGDLALLEAHTIRRARIGGLHGRLHLIEDVVNGGFYVQTEETYQWASDTRKAKIAAGVEYRLIRTID